MFVTGARSIQCVYKTSWIHLMGGCLVVTEALSVK